MDLVREGKYKWVVTEEITDATPRQFEAYCFIKRTPFRVVAEERLLRAGHAGTDTVFMLTAFRFWYKGLLSTLTKATIGDEVPVYLLGTWGPDNLGKLHIPEEKPVPYLGLDVLKCLEEDISRIQKGVLEKTGALLYGPPGNGKSFLIRALALRNKLPMYVLILTPGTDNLGLVRMFSHIKGPALLVIEDFDSYFDNRIPQDVKAQYTFDVFLNVLDGVYASMKNIVVLMTVNTIDKVDPALRYRPSRFKYVKELPYPNKEVCKEILGEYGHRLVGHSLDALLFIKDRLSVGASLEDAIKEIDEIRDNSLKAQEELKRRENEEKKE